MSGLRGIRTDRIDRYKNANTNAKPFGMRQQPIHAKVSSSPLDL